MKVTIYALGSALYIKDKESGEDNPAGVSIDHIHDTTKDGKSLPVCCNGTFIGFATHMSKSTHDDNPILKYVAEIDEEEFNPTFTTSIQDGVLGLIKGVMWTSGLYPTVLMIITS